MFLPFCDRTRSYGVGTSPDSIFDALLLSSLACSLLLLLLFFGLGGAILAASRKFKLSNRPIDL